MNVSLTDRIEALIALLDEAEAAHGAYEAAELGGIYDDDWPRWYAAYAIEHDIGEIMGGDVSSERLADVLARTFEEFKQADSQPEPWSAYTARRIATEL